MKRLYLHRLLLMALMLFNASGIMAMVPEPHSPMNGSDTYSRLVLWEKNQTLLGFGMGVSSSTLFTSKVDQILFPGFNISSSWSNPELLIELRGRFFFGDIDAYQFEASGYRSFTTGKPNLYVGGGLGYGGMNLKELLVFDINGNPFPGTFFHNGKGLHTFVGVGCWLKSSNYYNLKIDLDYFVSMYNIDNIQAPTGLRLSLTCLLHAPGQ